MSLVRRLRVLTLWGGQLIALPECFGQLWSLETLTLGGEQLTALPDSFGQLWGLKTLKLGGNLPSAVLFGGWALDPEALPFKQCKPPEKVRKLTILRATCPKHVSRVAPRRRYGPPHPTPRFVWTHAGKYFQHNCVPEEEFRNHFPALFHTLHRP